MRVRGSSGASINKDDTCVIAPRRSFTERSKHHKEAMMKSEEMKIKRGLMMMIMMMMTMMMM
eukprot:1636454-Prorocentrum_lima.AAC.1